MASDEKEVYLTIHHALNATALLYANRLERKQSCSLQKAVNTWLRPEGQPYSSSSPALGQSSSEVKPHLGAVVSTVPAAQPHPCCCEQLWSGPGPAPCPVPAVAVTQPALPGASTGTSQAEMGCSSQQNHHWHWHTWEKGVEMSLLAALWDRDTLASARKSVQPASLSCPTLLNKSQSIYNRDQKPSLPTPCWCG